MFFCVMTRVHPRATLLDTLFPTTTLFRSLAETLRAEACCIEHVVLMSDHAAPAGLIDYEAAIARADAAPDAMRGGDDIATIFFTGGTTGLPKGDRKSTRLNSSH